MKVEFFKPEDFPIGQYGSIDMELANKLSSLANAKLEREARRVYASPECNPFWSTNATMSGASHTALLIDIRELQPCQHEPGKVKHELITETSKNIYAALKLNYECECGARVRPSGFKAVE